MIYVAFAIDPSTEFLRAIPEALKSISIEFEPIEIHPNFESYRSSFDRIAGLPDNSTILFLGHGSAGCLYGGENPNFKKKSFVKIEQMEVFRNKKLLAVACDSSDLLKRSLRCGIRRAIGFKQLPTEMREIEDSKLLNKTVVGQSDLEQYRNALIELISEALIFYSSESGEDFCTTYDYLRLLINKRINNAILEENNPAFADILFGMKAGMSLF